MKTKMKQSIHKLFCLVLAGGLALSLLAPAAWAAEEDTVRIRTAEDLAALSRACTLDSWSRGKTVFLEADIDLIGRDFACIPTFGGTFEGQGHTISGLSVTGSGNVRGLFRYIQPTGVVRDLSVKGAVAPTDRKNTLGGLAGRNSGLLSGCTFEGSVTGTDSVGGLVGINEAEGQLINCAFAGSVTGEHYVGGVAGQNLGAMIRCQNAGSVNTTEVEAQLELDDMNREQLNAAENLPACTDIGGVAGFSGGILQSCVNTGAVGYAHVGYNIGGVVGRQSGYLSGCTNSGKVLGRKDVGGIAGQVEPEVRLLYDQGQMDGLLDELDRLRGLLDQTGGDLRGASDQVARRMQAMSDTAGQAREAVGELGKASADWVDGTAEEISSLTARISWLADAVTPILADAADAAELAGQLAGQLNDVLDQALAAGTMGSDGAEELSRALGDLSAALKKLRASQTKAGEALERLKGALGSSDDTVPALEACFAAARTLAKDCAGAAEAGGRVLELLWNAGGLTVMTPEEQQALSAALADLRDALSQTAEALPAAGAALTRLADSSIQPEEVDAARKDARAAWKALADAVDALRGAAEKGQSAARDFRDTLEQLGEAGQTLRKAGKTLETLFGRAAGLGEDLRDVAGELAEEPVIVFRPVSSAVREQGEALGGLFSQLLADGDALREAVSDATDTLLDDLSAINDQLGVITDLLRKQLEGSEEKGELFEDVSDRETGAGGTGSLSDARNEGTVEGDVNVGGIVGSMAIEYDFDPEDDLIREGDRSLDFRYQTRAVVTNCVNTGTITGKQDCVGGVAGLMDLGRVSGCENYGDLSSTNGDYVGGVAGASWGSIRGCWSKCRLSGGDYIGGVAGLGATLVDCRALVSIDRGSAYLGAVAGDVNDGGAVSGNTFTSDSLGALDGISYAGRAEPVAFDVMCAAPGVPERFTQLELTFVAGGETVAVVPFQYGEGIGALPEIPARKGYSAAWPELDYTCLTASQTLEAVYTPYSSALSDGGELPDILVDGSFSSRAKVSHTVGQVSWTGPSGRQYGGAAYTVTVEDPDLEQISYTVHIRLPDQGKRYTLWVKGPEGWTEAEYQLDGHYLLAQSRDKEVTFCLTERPGLPVLWIAAASAGAALAAAVGFKIVRLRRRKPQAA